MKKFILVCLMALTFPNLSMPQRRVVVPEVEEQVKEAIKKYDFDTAEELLETRILALTKKKLPTDNEEEQVVYKANAAQTGDNSASCIYR